MAEIAGGSIADFGLRIPDWKAGLFNPQFEIRNPKSPLHAHASEAFDVGNAIDVAELVDSLSQLAGAFESVNFNGMKLRNGHQLSCQ